MTTRPKLKFKDRTVDLPDENEAFAFSLGSLLGDGSMKANESRICIEQSDLGFTEWKKKKAVELGIATFESSISKVERSRRDKKTNQVTNTTSYRFYTRSLYSTWHEYFYVIKSKGDPTFNPSQKPTRRKFFPKELIQWFNHPLALAVFYMDDGGVQGNQPYLATGEISLNEVKNFQIALKENFNIETTIRYSQSVAVGLLVRRHSCRIFHDLVEPYVSQVPSMQYKLNFNLS